MLYGEMRNYSQNRLQHPIILHHSIQAQVGRLQKWQKSRTERAWQDKLCDDLQAMNVNWKEAKSVTSDRKSGNQ